MKASLILTADSSLHAQSLQSRQEHEFDVCWARKLPHAPPSLTVHNMHIFASTSPWLSEITGVFSEHRVKRTHSVTKTSSGIHSPFFTMWENPQDWYCHRFGEMMNEVVLARIVCGQQSKNRKTMMMTIVREVETWAFGVRGRGMYKPRSIQSLWYVTKLEKKRWVKKRRDWLRPSK